MLRLGIIGAGGIASLHTHNILSGKCPEVQLTAMADRKESRREWIRATVPDAAVFCEGSDLIASDTCDAVLIATPHYQHPTLAIEAFRHGKHVLCEKPAGVYTLQVRDMIAEADKHPELTFGMMFNQRTNCVYRKAKELIDSGALGENRLENIGTRARIRIENDQLTLDTLSVDERDWCPVCKEPFGVPEIQHEIVQTDGENPQHAGVLNAFAAHILHGTPLVADGREGIRGLMLSNAMHLSSWTNQTVSLPVDEELFLKLLNEKRRTSRHKDEVDAAIDVSGSFGSTRK